MFVAELSLELDAVEPSPYSQTPAEVSENKPLLWFCDFPLELDSDWNRPEEGGTVALSFTVKVVNVPGLKPLTLTSTKWDRKLQSQGTGCALVAFIPGTGAAGTTCSHLHGLSGLRFHRSSDTGLLEQRRGPQDTLNFSLFTQQPLLWAFQS